MTSPNGRIHAEASVVALAPASEPVKTLVMPDNTRNDSRYVPENRSRYDQPEMVAVIKQTVAKGASDAQLRMFLEVCRSTGLDPFLKEIYFVAEKSIIMASRDGYLRVANESPMFDGMETLVTRDANNVPVKATCSVWRKDRGHAITCEAYYSEYRKPGPVWTQYPSAMISKVAEVLALKRSFSINGVVTEEEMGEPRADADSRPLPPAAEPRIDIGNNPPNSRAAQQYVAAQKIATGILEPARTFETMRDRIGKTMSAADRGFQSMRERVGEDTFLAELARYGWHSFLDIRKALTAAGPVLEIAKTNVADCYWRMEDIANKGGK